MGKSKARLALAVAAAARLVPLLFGWEHYGDSPVRIEIAERWAISPHLWRGFAETFQYGPLHLTLIGLLIRAGLPRIAAARALSFVCGLACVWLVGVLARRLRSEETAQWAMFGLALSPLHIQASTTGASEAPFLALLLGAVLLLEERPIVSALLIGAAGLVRYDGWLYAPLLLLILTYRRRRFVAFALVAAAPALFWLWVNARYTGDALAPIRFIDADHRALAKLMIDWFGPLRWRAYGLVYWPVAVCGVLSPLFGALAMCGAFKTLRQRSAGWEIAALAWLPAAYLTFRTAVLLDFRPMARFAMVAATLSLPFARDVFGPRLRAAAAVVLVAWPLVLAGISWNRNGAAAEWARPLSPISSVPPGIASAASWLRANARPDDVVLMDSVWDYLDVPLVLAANLPDQQWIRASWTNDFEFRLSRRTPTLAVLLYQGKLGDWTRDEFDFRGQKFCLRERYVYATVYSICGN
jgi:4-amino-4-deoxy-L-arabinose transferase-like glycosyltransferase